MPQTQGGGTMVFALWDDTVLKILMDCTLLLGPVSLGQGPPVRTFPKMPSPNPLIKNALTLGSSPI
jgi:hypothetical protein